MLSPKEILNMARGRWPAALRAEVAGEDFFPLAIPFGRPRTTSDFAAIRAALTHLATAEYGWHILWEDVDTRKWGKQRWPRRVSFDSIESLADGLHLAEQLEAFREAVALARAQCAGLEPWLRARAHKIPELLPDWKELISVCAFYDANPFPHCFARQLPIAVGTKFIEEHTGILAEMLAVVLGDRVNASSLCFEERFHLRVEPPQVRFRFLDRGLRERVGWPVMDCTVYAEDLAGLCWAIPRILIVENKAVFLCLPDMPDVLAILGSGKAASLLPACAWLQGAKVVYWGDCDEAGFGILSALRARLPDVRSMLMDAAAWKCWGRFAVAGKRDLAAQHAYLTMEEAAALRAVKAGPWMLEQERIPLEAVERALFDAFAENFWDG
jgi:hypothetical protein